VLVKDYSYYLLQFIDLVLFSAWGFVVIVLLVAAVAARIASPGWKFSFAGRTPLLLIVVAAAVFLLGFYSIEYEFDVSLERIEQAKTSPDDKDCGSAWTGWYATGLGYVNKCPKGCYRGITLRQTMKMSGIFPPWPVTNRELKCWYRSEIDGVIPMQSGFGVQKNLISALRLR
jgi:hypothetical protein